MANAQLFDALSIVLWSFLNTEAVPLDPPQVLALCSVVVWYTPAVTSAVDIMITGYDVRFYSPQSDTENVIRHVGANQTFYIVQNEDKTVANLEDIYVQVIRLKHKINVIHKSTPVLHIPLYKFESFMTIEPQESGVME